MTVTFRRLSKYIFGSIIHPKRHFTVEQRHIIKDINNELKIALEYLPKSVSESVVKGMINPAMFDTNYVHKGFSKRPQYSCGYSKDVNCISIYFHHSDPTPKDTITDLNIKHQEIILNNKSFWIHSGFINYLTNQNNEFIETITNEIETLQKTYKYNIDLNTNTRLILSGQSLGAALCQLFYILLYSKCEHYQDYHQRLKEVIPINLENTFVITFGSPSFIFCENVSQYFKNPDIDNDEYSFYDLDQRIFNFHDENDPIPLLITGQNKDLQTKQVSFREVVRCSPQQRLKIASNSHLGNNFLITNNECINMEQTDNIKQKYLENGASYLWNEKINNMRQLLTLFAKNHWPHHYKNRLHKFL